jgi:MFS transporter, FSR family, fosmidomycin resistance protein
VPVEARYPGLPVEVVPWAALLAVAGGHLAVDCCTGIWPVFKTLAHLDLAKAGLIATVGSMAGNGLQIFFGTLADRGWRKRLLVVGAAMAGAVTLVPWVTSYAMMFVLQMLTNLGSALYHPAGTGAAGEASRARTGVMIGIFLAGGYGGYAFSQMLFSSVYRHSVALTPVIMLVPLVAAAAIAVVVPAPRPEVVLATRSARLEAGVVATLVPLFLVQVFATAASQSLIFLLPDLMEARQAPGWIVGGGAHFSLIAGSCLALLPAGHAADRWGGRRVLMVGNAATGILLALLLSRSTASAWDLALVMAFGLFNGVNTVVTVAEGNRLLPGRASGVSALLMGLPWCVAALGPVLAGLLAEPTHGGSPALALSWLGLAIPLALVASVAVRPRRA